MKLTLLFIVALLLSACDQNRLQQSDNPLHLPAAGFVADAAQGETLYRQNCQSCHGVSGAGSGQGPALTGRIYGNKHHADLSFHLAVKNGVRSHHATFGDMPAMPQVSPEQAGHIIAYVRQIQHQPSTRISHQRAK